MYSDWLKSAGEDLLDTFVAEGNLDVLYLKGNNFSLAPVALPRPVLLLPRGSGHVDVRCADSKGSFIVDATANLLLPAGQKFELIAYGDTCELLILAASPELIASTITEYNIDKDEFRRAFAERNRFARTLWFSEIGHRYFFERCMCRKSDNKATAFLEGELIKECFYAFKEKGKDQGKVPFLFDQQSTAKRAINYIEANLFKELSLESIAKKSATSRASLLRAFKTEIGKSPIEYVQARRLQEATQLLRRQQFDVAEVALRVGYQSVSAFSQAFRRQFGRSPSAYAKEFAPLSNRTQV